MSSQRRKTALVTVLAVPALALASTVIASAQPSSQSGSVSRLAVERSLQEQQRRAEELQRALAMAQEMRVRPTIRLGGGLFELRSGGLATRALASAEELELTDTQHEAIRETQRAHRRDEIRRNADIEIAELELEEMMEAGTLDLQAIESHMRQIANLQVDERMADLRLDRAVRDLLTADQIDKLEEMMPGRTIIETYRQRDR